ncbi:protein serrate [Caerostris darwini]|uniref:Delta-like protein n=1 Tax=Caerostris darwini TaxID=1538125 RepID=A0AAV4XB72_9ARAC|nr:protein serrate [Caerostris darwini]
MPYDMPHALIHCSVDYHHMYGEYDSVRKISQTDNQQQTKATPSTDTPLTVVIDSFAAHLERVIERHVFSGVQIPGMEWKIKSHRGRAARISYRYRVLCSPHYYDYTCAKFCRPRNDRFGHYKCDEQGDKVCLEGWQGPNCETAVCKLGCHPEHGFCTKPARDFKRAKNGEMTQNPNNEASTRMATVACPVFLRQRRNLFPWEIHKKKFVTLEVARLG